MDTNNTSTMTIRNHAELLSGKAKPTWGICAVALPRESYYWLKDWIDHHIRAGADRVVIYDNTGSVMSLRSTSGFRSGKLQKAGKSKRGEEYGRLTRHLSDDEIRDELQAIADGYGGKVRIVRWRPRHPKYNVIIHGQMEAFCHFIQTNKDEIDWGLFIDLDEYVYCKPGLSIGNLLTNVQEQRPDIALVQLKDWQFECRWAKDGPKDLATLTRHHRNKRGYGKMLALMREVTYLDNHLNWKTSKGFPALFIYPGDCGFAHYNQRRESLKNGIEWIKPREFLDVPLADEIEIRTPFINKFNSLVKPMPVTKTVRQIDGTSLS